MLTDNGLPCFGRWNFGLATLRLEPLGQAVGPASLDGFSYSPATRGLAVREPGIVFNNSNG